MKVLGSSVVVVVLAAGLALLGYARWTGAIKAADDSLASGDLQSAIASYQIAEGRFETLPAARQMVPGEHARVVANHLWALYRLQRFDEVIDLAQKAPAESAPHFWSACAFFQKATVEEKPEARLGWLGRAEEEFRKAVEAAPDDWDTKYNFELTSRLSAELRKQPNTPPKQLMMLLRPPTPGSKTPRRTG